MVHKIEKHLRAIGLLLQFKTPLKPVYTTLDEFVKGVFTLKTHHMFSVHTTPVEFKTTTIRVTNSHVDSVAPYPLCYYFIM